jgi:lysophospholipase L1-like esterase
VKRRIRYEYVELSHDALVRAFAACDSAIFRAAELEGVPVFDLSSKFSGREDLFADHLHTRMAGSQTVAKEAAAYLAERIREERRVGAR